MSKTFIITGASSGIGFSTAKLLLKKGHCVINLARNICDLPGVVNYQIDLGSSSEIELFATKLKVLIKEKKPITLVHNAFSYTSDSFIDFDQKKIESSIAVGLIAPMLLNKYVSEYMGKGSSIIFIGSTLSEKSVANSMSYTTLKHSTIGLMRSCTQDLALLKEVHTCCICPGFTRTNMLESHLNDKAKYKLITDKVAFKRLIEPEEIADLILFCSINPLVNGSVIHANLGQIET